MTSNAQKLQLSFNKERVGVPDAIDFIIHIVYNFPKSKKTVAHSRYATAIKTSKMGKKKFNDTRKTPNDNSILKIKIMRVNFVTSGICMLIFL